MSVQWSAAPHRVLLLELRQETGDSMTRPSAKQIAREFKGGKTMASLILRYGMTQVQVEEAIRPYVKPEGGRNGR